MKERPDHASWVTHAEKRILRLNLKRRAKKQAERNTTWQALKIPKYCV